MSRVSIWFLKSKPNNVKRLSNLREKLQRYPRPFAVEYFVDHLIVRDANNSECFRMAREVEDALNLIAESTDVPPEAISDCVTTSVEASRNPK